jgi:calcineurin-like phosphoesterase family protein
LQRHRRAFALFRFSRFQTIDFSDWILTTLLAIPHLARLSPFPQAAMSELWFTADLHLGHANIIRYCRRPFLTDEEAARAAVDPRGRWKVSAETVIRHDDALLEAINSRVGPGDTLWILGDFSLATIETARAYRERIRCRQVHFVRGNHDLPSYETLFDRVVDQGMIKHLGKKIWLNHYPMRSWDKAFHGAWHLYGHVHGRLGPEDDANPRLLAKDVGVDACGYRPVSFTEITEHMKPREEAFWAWRESLGEAGEEG